MQKFIALQMQAASLPLQEPEQPSENALNRSPQARKSNH
jgi:hypothetical protein